MSVEHQVPHVLERALLSEVDSRVLPVVVEPLLASHVTDLGIGDDDPGQSTGHFHQSGHCDLLVASQSVFLGYCRVFRLVPTMPVEGVNRHRR